MVLYIKLFLYWVWGPLRYILGNIITLPACYRGNDNHFIVLSHWSITPQAKSHDIPLYSGNGSSSFYVELPFICRSFWQGSFNYQFEIFGLTRPYVKHSEFDQVERIKDIPFWHSQCTVFVYTYGIRRIKV